MIRRGTYDLACGDRASNGSGRGKLTASAGPARSDGKVYAVVKQKGTPRSATALSRRQPAMTTMGRFAPGGKVAAKSPERHLGEAALKSVV